MLNVIKIINTCLYKRQKNKEGINKVKNKIIKQQFINNKKNNETKGKHNKYIKVIIILM
jgi:hypothetical protein